MRTGRCERRSCPESLQYTRGRATAESAFRCLRRSASIISLVAAQPDWPVQYLEPRCAVYVPTEKYEDIHRCFVLRDSSVFKSLGMIGVSCGSPRCVFCTPLSRPVVRHLTDPGYGSIARLQVSDPGLVALVHCGESWQTIFQSGFAPSTARQSNRVLMVLLHR
jgi:hypothetical protein